ncbi:hypothetical protein BKI52_43090 [marine bacterium AO1-C]|nr:hypothetical protein BKI52_43090 [marine bacterium AO1-C]
MNASFNYNFIKINEIGDETIQRKAVTLANITFISLVLLIISAIIFYYTTYNVAGHACLGSIASLVLVGFIFRYNHSINLATNLYTLTAFTLFSIILITSGGIHSSWLYWFTTVPISAYYLTVNHQMKHGIFWTFACLIIYFIAYYLDAQGIQVETHYPKKWASTIKFLFALAFFVYVVSIILINDLQPRFKLTQVLSQKPSLGETKYKDKARLFELERENRATKTHQQMIWIAIIVLPFFPDYFFAPAIWQQLFTLRMVVIAYFLLLIFAQRKLRIRSIFVAYASIIPLSVFLSYASASVPTQNLFIYNLNYSALFIVAALYVLMHWGHFVAIIFISGLLYSVFFIVIQDINFFVVVEKGALLLFTVALASIGLAWYRFTTFKKEFFLRYALGESNEKLSKQNVALETQQQQILQQKEKLEEKNTHITASISYAQRIQQAILPPIKDIQAALPDSFILFRPRDIVSGDFYWFKEIDDKIFISAVDCTGHGVPGAFMSMIGNELLHKIVTDFGITEVDQILGKLNESVRKALQQDETNNRDGMDMTMVGIHKQTSAIEFAGAKNPIYYVQNGEMHQIKGDKTPIGGMKIKRQDTYTKHLIDVSQPTTFYLFSDGFQDQFGGPNNKRFMTKQFRELLLSIHSQPMDTQKQLLEQALEDWMQEEEQLDDILVIGVRCS